MDANLITFLERDFSPPPHVFEQGDQSPYGPHSQSTAHPSVLHGLVSVASPSQAFPPLFSGVDTYRWRDFSPPPHVFEQDDHSPYDPHSQSTAHPSVLHGLVSVASPSQAFPPLDTGLEADLWRDFSPPPHVFEQDDHSPYNPQLQSTGSKI